MNNAIRRATLRLDAAQRGPVGVSLAVLALASLAIAGCETAPKATLGLDTGSSAAPQAGSSGSSAASPSAGPQRLEAKRAPRSAEAADPTAGLMNPGDEVDGNTGAERLSAATRARASRPAPPADPVTPSPRAGREPTAEELAAAERLAASRSRTARAGDSRVATAPPAGSGSGAASGASANRAASKTARPEDERPAWSVLLASFTGDDHRANATSAREQIARRYPDVKECFVRTTTRGSVVLIGRFDGPQDPAAQAELKRVKELEQDGKRVFGRAMLTRMGASADLSPPGPNDLRSVRAQAPRQTLYTLQVAVWSALGTDEMKMSEIKRSAEGYCRQLRSQGNDAYYFHDFDTKTSVVTVGVFGPDSYDSRSTLYSPEVEAMMKKFPKHLVNGEELMMPADPSNPASKMIPQAPRLVEVPKL